jgi:hypothetical protein
LKPGLSEVELDEDEEEEKFGEENKIPIKQFKVKKYVFRTKNDVYEYTIRLQNDLKKNKEIENIRNKILKKMYDKSNTMKKNLVGLDFIKPPFNPKETRIIFTGDILYAFNFEAFKISINFFLQIPNNYEFENKTDKKLVYSTQNGISKTFYNLFDNNKKKNIVHFNFPFQFDFISKYGNIFFFFR